MTGVLKDLFSGNFSGVVADIESAFAKLPQAEQDFITKLESDAWNLIRSLASVAINDVVAGGFSTASFVTAGKDIVAQGEAQGQAIGISDAITQLNILAAAIRPAAEAPASPPATPPTPVTADTPAVS